MSKKLLEGIVKAGNRVRKRPRRVVTGAVLGLGVLGLVAYAALVRPEVPEVPEIGRVSVAPVTTAVSVPITDTVERENLEIEHKGSTRGALTTSITDTAEEVEMMLAGKEPVGEAIIVGGGSTDSDVIGSISIPGLFEMPLNGKGYGTEMSVPIIVDESIPLLDGVSQNEEIREKREEEAKKDPRFKKALARVQEIFAPKQYGLGERINFRKNPNIWGGVSGQMIRGSTKEINYDCVDSGIITQRIFREEGLEAEVHTGIDEKKMFLSHYWTVVTVGSVKLTVDPVPPYSLVGAKHLSAEVLTEEDVTAITEEGKIIMGQRNYSVLRYTKQNDAEYLSFLGILSGVDGLAETMVKRETGKEKEPVVFGYLLSEIKDGVPTRGIKRTVTVDKDAYTSFREGYGTRYADFMAEPFGTLEGAGILTTVWEGIKLVDDGGPVLSYEVVPMEERRDLVKVAERDEALVLRFVKDVTQVAQFR